MCPAPGMSCNRQRGINRAMVVSDDKHPSLGEEAAKLVGPEHRVRPGAGDQEGAGRPKDTKRFAPKTNRPALDELDHGSSPPGDLAQVGEVVTARRVLDRP